MKTPFPTRTGGSAASWKIPTPTTGEISLYFHIPFCRRKCPYCNFYSTYFKEEEARDFVKALKDEIAAKEPLFRGKEIASIYFGGGNPFLLEEAELFAILEMLPKAAETTIEANPEDIALEKVKALKLLGFDRLSIGVQSFDDEMLKLLGRRHTKEKSLKAISDSLKAGIDNISIDLIYNLPNETIAGWDENLKAIPFQQIKHISLYDLVIEKNTPFFRIKKKLKKLIPQEKESLSIFKRTAACFKAHGLKRYEISAFAKKGYCSTHNMGYWTGRPFLGFGPAAYSYLDGRRFKNVASLREYSKRISERKDPVDFEERLSQERAQNELLAINLRLIEGVDIPHFQKRFGMLSPELTKKLAALKEMGLVNISKSKIRLTAKGLLFYDTAAGGLV